MNSYFNNMMFNPQYVNANYYNQIRQFEYNQNQDKKVRDAIKAMHDLCRCSKRYGPGHQQQAFLGCLGVMAEELNWKVINAIEERVDFL